MRVKAGDHASDGIADEFLLVHGLDVVALDHAEHSGQLLQFFQGQRCHVGACRGLQRDGGQCAGQGADGDPACNLEFLTHVAFENGQI